MQCKTLGTDEVLSRGRLRGDVEVELGDVVSGPGQTVGSGGLGGEGVDPRPVARAVVGGGRRGGLGQVDLLDARVAEGARDAEADAVTRLHGEGLGRSAAGTAHVAAHVGGKHICDRGVGVGRATDVFVLCACKLTVVVQVV